MRPPRAGGPDGRADALAGAAKDIGVYQTGEAIRGLAKLEADERVTPPTNAGTPSP